MPKREDEYWAGRSQQLRYCYTHMRYYRSDAGGCQVCLYEQVTIRWQRTEGLKEQVEPLEKCPACQKVSLFWNRVTEMYECLNPACEESITPQEFKALADS